jgi:hypothetical protein
VVARPCPQCEAPDNTPIGVLGNTAHYRCRACGWSFSHALSKRMPPKFRNGVRSAS